MKNNPPFARIALMGRHHPKQIGKTLQDVCEFLTARHYPVVCDAQTAALFPLPVNSVPTERLHEHCDLLIVVGGDGSLLHAAKIAVEQSLPILGVNRGRLGFLTDVYPRELEILERILAGKYIEEKRFLLSLDVYREDKFLTTIDALNEIVLTSENIAQMIEFEVSIDKQFVCDLRADGLIVATPTGSTAYALSGGGPIVQPVLNAVVLVPMFPHTLSNRPLMIDADSSVMIQMTPGNRGCATVNGDGQERTVVTNEETLYIRKKEVGLRLIHPLNYSYFHTLRNKLGWQSKQTLS